MTNLSNIDIQENTDTDDDEDNLFLRITEAIFVGWFTLEYLIRFAVSPHKVSYPATLDDPPSLTIPGGVPPLLAQHHRRSRHPPLLHVPAPQQTLLRVLSGVHRQGGSDLQNPQNTPDIQTFSTHHRPQNSGLHSKKQSTVIINNRLPVWCRASCPLPGSCCC